MGYSIRVYSNQTARARCLCVCCVWWSMHPPHPRLFIWPSGIRNGYGRSEKQFICPGLVCRDLGAWVRELCWMCLRLPPCVVLGTWPSSVIRLNFGFCTTERVGSSDRSFIVSSECPHKGSSGILTSLWLLMVLLGHRHKNSGIIRRTVPWPFPSTSVPALHAVIILLLVSIFWVVDSIVKYTTKKHIALPVKIRVFRTIIICIYAHRTTAGIS